MRVCVFRLQIVLSAVLAVALAGLLPLVPADTPEVAAAKAAHFAAVAEASARVGAVPYGGIYPLLTPGGVPLDTPEVAAAKVANAVAHAQARARVGGYAGVPFLPGVVGVHYDGTLLTADGVPLDTPDVAAGKFANAIAHAKAKSLI